MVESKSAVDPAKNIYTINIREQSKKVRKESMKNRHRKIFHFTVLALKNPSLKLALAFFLTPDQFGKLNRIISSFDKEVFNGTCKMFTCECMKDPIWNLGGAFEWTILQKFKCPGEVKASN